MSLDDWLSYSLQDFLMFGPEVFLRLFVRLNQQVWPWQLAIMALALMLPWILAQNRAGLRVAAMGLVAAAWVGSGLGFLACFYGEINWPARWFGWAFVGQGIALAVLGGARSTGSEARAASTQALWLVAIGVLPWLPVIQTGDVLSVAIVGLFPDTTVAASVLLLARFSRWQFWMLLPVPLLWVAFSATTYWALQLYWLLLFPAATLLMLGYSRWLSPRPGQSPGPQSARRGRGHR